MPWLLVLALLALGIGCGDSDSGEPSGDGSHADVNADFNTCPVFTRYMVLPHEIEPGGSADVSALATDPDQDDAALIYAWSATSGSFTNPLMPATQYRCGSAGSQLLTVKATDERGCYARLDLDVSCH